MTIIEVYVYINTYVYMYRYIYIYIYVEEYVFWIMATLFLNPRSQLGRPRFVRGGGLRSHIM